MLFTLFILFLVLYIVLPVDYKIFILLCCVKLKWDCVKAGQVEYVAEVLVEPK